MPPCKHMTSYRRPFASSAMRSGSNTGLKPPKPKHISRCQPIFALFKFDLAPKPGGIREKPAFSARETVQLGPLRVSPLGLGTWSWGNQLLWGYNTDMDAELQRVFNEAVSRGVNIFDTADSYGTGRLNGRSEQLLGRFLQEYPGTERVRRNVCIATKFAAYPWRLTRRQMVAACKGSLHRLGAEQVAIGQLHWSAANYAPLQERALWDGLVAMYDEGLVQAVGVSNFGPRQMQRLQRHLEQRGVPLASAQVQFSLLSCGKDQRDIQSACNDLGVTLISYSPLALGMLTGKYNSAGPLPKGPRGALFKQILPGAEPLLDLMQKIAIGRGKTMSQVAINWCICQNTVPIPGAKDLQQVQGNLGALGWRLKDGELAALDAEAAKVPRSMVQNIFQTK